MKLYKKVSITIFGLLLLVFPVVADINLSGTIIDMKGNPVNLGICELVNSAVKDTTGTDGIFTLVSNAIINTHNSVTASQNHFSIRNNSLVFRNTSDFKHAEIALFDSKGKTLYSTTVKGKKSAVIPLADFSKSIYFAAVTKPFLTSVHSIYNLNIAKHTQAKPQKATQSKRSDFALQTDTLKITAPNFSTRKIPVDNFFVNGLVIPLFPAINLSPPGERIFFTKPSIVDSMPFNDIWSIKSDGTDPQQLTKFSSIYINVATPEMCANGTHLSFASNLNTGVSAFYYDIFLLEPLTGTLRRVTGDERPWIPPNYATLDVTVIDKGLAISPSQFRVSAKGTFGFVPAESGGSANTYKAQLIVPADEKIWVKAEKAKGQGAMDFITVPKGTNGTITLSVQNGGTFSAEAAGPSPDASNLAITTVFSKWDFTNNNEDPFWAVDVWSSTTGVKLFEQLGADPHLGGDRDATYSSDGSTIALVVGDYTITSLVTVPASAPHDQTVLAQGFNDVLGTVTGILGAHVSCVAPCFSRDGTCIVFSYVIMTPNGDLHSKLYTVPTDGSSEAVAISSNPNNTIITSPTFSPDGSLLAFAMLTSKNVTFNVTDLASFNYTADIYTMAATGGTYTQITTDGISSDPTWGNVQ